MTEDQVANLITSRKNNSSAKQTDVSEDNSNVNETISGGENVFEAEFDYMEIDVMDNGGFKQSILSSIPENYDTDLRFNKAKVTYTISFEYRSYGVKNIYLQPKSIYLSGELTIESENDTTSKDFEIEYGLSGLESNTLSGPMDLEGSRVVIGDLPKEVEFAAKRTADNSTGVYATAIGVEMSTKNFKITVEY